MTPEQAAAIERGEGPAMPPADVAALLNEILGRLIRVETRIADMEATAKESAKAGPKGKSR